MKSTINELYYGEICPCKLPAPNTKRYKENNKFISDTSEQLIEKYPDIKETLEKFIDAQHIATSLECEADFERGFRLGAQFTAELLGGIEE